MSEEFLFTSESVSEGHPDKVSVYNFRFNSRRLYESI